MHAVTGESCPLEVCVRRVLLSRKLYVMIMACAFSSSNETVQKPTSSGSHLLKNLKPDF